jgi:hypothetical protein
MGFIMVYSFWAPVLFAFTVISNIITAASASSPEWISYLLNGGPFAVLVLLILLDKLTTPVERDRLRTENEQLREQVKTLNESLRIDIVPPLMKLNELMKQVLDQQVKADAEAQRLRRFEMEYYEDRRRKPLE